MADLEAGEISCALTIAGGACTKGRLMTVYGAKVKATHRLA